MGEIPFVLRQASDIVAAAEASLDRSIEDVTAEGRRLAHDVCRIMCLKRSAHRPSMAIIAALRKKRGWAINVRPAIPDELYTGHLDFDTETGRVHMCGPATWEIIVTPHTRPMHQEMIILTLLAHVILDDVPLRGRSRTTMMRTSEEVRAHSFAITIVTLLTHDHRRTQGILDILGDHPPHTSVATLPYVSASGATRKAKNARKVLRDLTHFWLPLIALFVLVVYALAIAIYSNSIDDALGPLLAAMLVLNSCIALGAGLSARDKDSEPGYQGGRPLDKADRNPPISQSMD